MDNSLQKLEELSRLKKKGQIEKYDILYQYVISVGEFKNVKRH